MTTAHQPPIALDVIETTSSAYKDGVHTLYKFMTYPRDAAPADNAERRRRVDALLRDGELYFATARELNDPFEAAPHFKITGNSPDEIFEALSRALRDKYAREWGWSEEQILCNEARLSEGIRTGDFHANIASLADTWRELFRSEYPMCCLAATQISTLMWSYYSSGHTGVCIHFDATQPPFTNAKRVIYSNQYPELPYPIYKFKPEVLLARGLLTKSLVWEHESEYRLINASETFEAASQKHILDDVFTWKTAQLAFIKPSFIVGVTIGASMHSDEIEDILRICHNRPIQIPVFQAKCRQDRFDLEIKQIA